MTFFATCPKGLEALLARELRGLGVETLQESVAGSYFDCALAIAYRVCMQSRVANRVVLVLLRREVDSAASLLEAASHCDWRQHFSATHSIAIDFNGSNEFIRNAKYGAQLVKDALNDHFRAQGQGRVQLDATAADVRIYARLFKRRFTLGVDLVGESLHRRGYRAAGGEAPLKENLAAALLMLCDWPAMASAGASFVDPMCGSGTLLVEAALQAGSIAPAYLRNDWPLLRLHSADAALWRSCLEHAAIDLDNVSLPCNIFGSDASAAAVQVAQQNLDRAGLAAHVQLRTVALAKLPADSGCFDAGTGLLLTNPPYGQRLGERGELSHPYIALGNLLKQHCTGWQAAILTDNAELGWSTGLRSFRQHKVNNGNIACQLLRYRVAPANYLKSRTNQQQVGKVAANVGAEVSAAQAATATGSALASGTATAALSEGATMLANRLRKNRRRLKAWLAVAAAPSYRLYDADLPEYAVAIDCYAARALKASGPWGATPQLAGPARQDLLQYFHVQEYAAPASVEPAIAKRRLAEAVAAVCAVFAVEPARVVVKRRERQRGKQQYSKLDSESRDLQVEESGYPLLVNLGKYLDTGLFLDHRPLRRLLGERCRGKRFLNLFAYTASATVHAARGGARSSVSVDMSKTYLEWARRNFALNDMPAQQHLLERADCREWLSNCKQYFDVILLDPPSFSNSSNMATTLDLQRDHVELIEQCIALLNPAGELYFSTNRRGFKLAQALHHDYTIEDLTSATHDPDFQRRRPAHFCWRITRRATASFTTASKQSV